MHTISRRKFIAMAGLTGAATFGGFPVMAAMKSSKKKITILHTNDTHSRIDPYPQNDPNFPDMGGYARRAAMIKQLRFEDPELLLLDAGDFFQGTPYYNMFGGEVELKLMSTLGYDAATLGNHEFDNGVYGFNNAIKHAQFPFVNANYDFSDTLLKGKIQPFIVLKRNGIKVGIYGLGIELRGLVAPSMFAGLKYNDPVEVARATEETLKNQHECQLIVCLSHLGFSYNHDKVSDVVVARQTRWTDIIIGGHTHTLLDPAVIEKNMRNQDVIIGQTGSGGVRLGKIEVIFDPSSEEKLVESITTKIYKNQEA
ncbi:MAG: metallophosphoesterase [Bacteroides sp.]|jgi:5'-nucleotidase|nr:metallophosphoesterase [Bacteroides sp.]